MAAYSGSSLYIQWASSAGTVTPNTDYRTCTYTPTLELIEETAGADATKSFIAGMVEGEAVMNFIMQAGGTAMTNAFREGASGTLTIAPEGTASGKQKMTFAGMAMGCQYSFAYNELVEVTATIKQIGNRTDSVY